MATPNTITEPTTELSGAGTMLVSLPLLSQDAFEQLLTNLATAFAGESIVVATPDTDAGVEYRNELSPGPLRVIGYAPTAPSNSSWTLTAADFLNAHELVGTHHADAVLILGAEAQSLAPAALRGLADAVLANECDLAVARYALPPRAGLVNSAILYPVSRALFAARPRFPLALDLCMSARMAEKLATVAQRLTATNQPEAIVWPVAEAAVAGYSIVQIEVGTRAVPAPPAADFNSLLAQITGSLFLDVDAKAAFWQRARPVQTERIAGSSPHTSHGSEEVQGMLETFRLAYTNLHEIWSLVLPPQSLLGLKRLSVMPPAGFRMGDSLWARIVYDFLLAYRLRTINRGHLLGALTPLYLAWAASHILMTEAGTDPERHIEALAAAFEADKPYLVSRWRWPDRFNP